MTPWERPHRSESLQQFFVVPCAVDDTVDKHIGSFDYIKDEIVLDHEIAVPHLCDSTVSGNLPRVRMLLQSSQTSLNGVYELFCRGGIVCGDIEKNLG
jgi:hypothetical protein